jgi:hypothetical protein
LASPSVVDRIKSLDSALIRPVGDEDIYVIASQDCDLCCDSFEEEPIFEVVVGRRLPNESEDGNLFYGKNPRKLQLWIDTPAGRKLYQLSVHERIPAPRSFLAEADDEPSGSLSLPDLDVFRRWLGRRYYRSALPTEFNERCRPAQGFVAEKLKKQGALITAVYLQIDPRYEELRAEELYRVFVHLTVLPETADSPNLLAKALLAKSSFEKAFAKCEGIDLLGVQIVPEDQFSLRDIQQSVRWDQFDYISYRAGAEGDIASEE